MVSHDDDSSYDGAPSSAALRLVSNRDDDDDRPKDKDEGDFNLRILQPTFRYLRNEYGDEGLDDIVRDCGIPPQKIHKNDEWITHEQLERVLSAVRELAGSDEEFMRVCTYELKKQYGAFLLIVRGMSIPTTFKMMARTSPMVCRASRFDVIDSSRTSVRVRYTTQHDESRLSCLSRQAQLKMGPTLFLGMAPAKLSERSCVAHGDDCCEYDLSWYEPVRLRFVLAGVALGAGVAALLPTSWVLPALSFSLLPLLGGIAGASVELRRLLDEHLRFSDTTAREMEDVVRMHSQAMDELNALQDRERNWNRALEDAVAERTKRLNAVVRRLQSALRRRTNEFPAVTAPSAADDGAPAPTPDLALADADAPVASRSDRVSKLMGELVDIAGEDPVKRSDAPETVQIDDLVVRIRRHLRAMIVGRDVRVTVFQTREAPETIVTVRSILERIIDNLVFNASRHTDRGSIVVEVGGTPGSLLLKLSDTGEGVSTERLQQVFGNESVGGGALNEHSSGLSSTARLLDNLGGRLEIMTEPAVGTTLWVYFPTKPVDEEPEQDESSEASSSMLGRVVTIRAREEPPRTDDER